MPGNSISMSVNVRSKKPSAGCEQEPWHQRWHLTEVSVATNPVHAGLGSSTSAATVQSDDRGARLLSDASYRSSGSQGHASGSQSLWATSSPISKSQSPCSAFPAAESLVTGSHKQSRSRPSPLPTQPEVGQIWGPLRLSDAKVSRQVPTRASAGGTGSCSAINQHVVEVRWLTGAVAVRAGIGVNLLREQRIRNAGK